MNSGEPVAHQHRTAEANSEKAGKPPQPRPAWTRAAALPPGVHASHRTNTCRLRVTEAIRRPAPCRRLLYRYLLSGPQVQVRFKNTGNFKAGGTSGTTAGSQPRTPTINILLAASPTATATPAPLLVVKLQAFPQAIPHNQPGAAKGRSAYALPRRPGKPWFSPSSRPSLVRSPKDQKEGAVKLKIIQLRSQFGA